MIGIRFVPVFCCYNDRNREQSAGSDGPARRGRAPRGLVGGRQGINNEHGLATFLCRAEALVRRRCARRWPSKPWSRPATARCERLSRGPTRWMRKSSTSAPSRSTACARTPAGALVDVAGFQPGPVRRWLRRDTRGATAIRGSPDAGPPVLPRQLAERRRAGQLGTASCRRHVTAPVSLAGEREHRVGAEVRPSPLTRGVKCTPRNGNAGVGHRVDEAAAPGRAGVRAQPQVLAAERDDLWRRFVAGRGGHQVGLQAGADDQPVDSQKVRPGVSTSTRSSLTRRTPVTAVPRCSSPPLLITSSPNERVMAG